MTPEHIEELRNLIARNTTAVEKPVALALFGIALEIYNKLERITVAFETIAAKPSIDKPVAMVSETSLHISGSVAEFQAAVVQAIKNAKTRNIL